MYKHIKWDKKLSLNNDIIDKEHKSLFEIYNLLHECEENILDKCIRKIKIYTKTHFFDEEKYMLSIGYPKLQKHIKLHKKIVNNFDKYIKDNKNKKFETRKKNFIEFVHDEMIVHIINEDSKIKNYNLNKLYSEDVIAWKNIYSIGNDEIDKEHKKLFELATKALNYNKNDLKTNVKSTVNELYSYMKEHFNNEEIFMSNISYPKIDKHIQKHEEIISDMNKFIKQLPKIGIEEFNQELIENIDVWLVNHIIYEDKKIHRWIANNNK